jgi:hypothetical protein
MYDDSFFSSVIHHSLRVTFIYLMLVFEQLLRCDALFWFDVAKIAGVRVRRTSSALKIAIDSAQEKTYNQLERGAMKLLLR